MVGLDTSVIIRLLIGEPVAQARAARAFLDELFTANEKAAVSDLVISEAYFALIYHYDVPKAEALSTLRALFESGEIVATGAVVSVLKTPNLATARPGFADQLIHADYEKHFGAMATFERKGSRLPGTRVLK